MMLSVNILRFQQSTWSWTVMKGLKSETVLSKRCCSSWDCPGLPPVGRLGQGQEQEAVLTQRSYYSIFTVACHREVQDSFQEISCFWVGQPSTTHKFIAQGCKVQRNLWERGTVAHRTKPNLLHHTWLKYTLSVIKGKTSLKHKWQWGYPSINILRNNRVSFSSCLSDSTSFDSLQMFPRFYQLPPLRVL